MTPIELRFLLLKFGLSFPQSTVDEIFNVLDADRSGTIDVNEFGHFVMTADPNASHYHTAEKKKKSAGPRVTHHSYHHLNPHISVDVEPHYVKADIHHMGGVHDFHSKVGEGVLIAGKKYW